MSKAVKTIFWLATVLVLTLAEPTYSQSFPASASQLSDEFDLANRLHWNYQPTGNSVSLYRWMIYQMNRTEEARRSPRKFPEYDRLYHFGGWINEDGPRDCFDTRQEVLIRAANPKVPVVFQSANKCKVATGAWLDPYTGQKLRAAETMDIDHVVALGHAYENGGYKWSPALRCHFANYLGNGFHLLAVSAHENRSKSAKDPSGYIPAYRPFVCTYLTFWLKIKMIWDLEISRHEAETIASLFKRGNCDMRAQVMGQSELREQQELASRPSLACERKMQGRGNKPPPMSNLSMAQ